MKEREEVYVICEWKRKERNDRENLKQNEEKMKKRKHDEVEKKKV